MGRWIEKSQSARGAIRHWAMSAWLISALMVWLPATPVVADEASSFVLRAGRILPVSPHLDWEIKSGVIIVRAGKIVAVGANLEWPQDLPVYDFPDAVVTPGLVAAATSLTLSHTGDESIGAAYRAIDTFDPFADWTLTIASGVTTVHLSPGEHRLVTGQGAVVKLGGPLGQRILRERADLTINFGEAAWHPPNDVTYQAPSSSDVAIPTPIRQRPDSRMGQLLALEEALGLSAHPEFATGHKAAFLNAWRDEQPLRIQALRKADIEDVIRLFRRHRRAGYLVGAAESNLLAGAILQANIPVVYRVSQPLRGGSVDLGSDPDALVADVEMLSSLAGIKLALAGPAHQPTADLRLAASTALRAGLSKRQVLEAMTRIPAEILGVADRVGSLAPGMDADFLVFSDDPLKTHSHVLRAYIGGELAFEAPKTDALVVRAGTIWVNPDRMITDGAILIEDGKISAVGITVPHPPFAKVINAGADAFVTPGFIDAHGHLGLEGDKSSAGPDISLVPLIGVPDLAEKRVARAGVTTVMMTTYSAASNGSRITAVKTAGHNRSDRLVRDTAGLYFDFRRSDPMDVDKRIKKRLEAGKKYFQKWEKYHKELAQWKEKRAKGESVNGEKKKEEVAEESGEADPITGTWSVTLSGGPIPEPQTGTMRLKLTGQEIEGYITIGGGAEESKFVATLDGTHISGHIEIEVGGLGYPQVEAEIVEEDHIVGTIEIQSLTIDLDAQRTDKAPVEFKVVKRKTRGKDGRPLPPKLDEALEPLRAAFKKQIPLVVAVRTPAQIEAVLTAVKEFEVSLTLLDANEASLHVDQLLEQDVGVIVPKSLLRRRQGREYLQVDDLSRKGIRVAFQSGGEDLARNLRLIGLHAVERGLGADQALAAMTTHASRLFLLEDRIGSLNPGCDGDLVIFNGHPFNTASKVMRVIVNGKQVQ